MDLRVERTRRSIVNAFLELRTKKDLEKITVKELAERAFINKATFYAHYRDIYDLSDKLQTETIDHMLACVPHPEELLTEPKQTMQMLVVAFLSNERLIQTLFSGSQSAVLVNLLEERLKKKIYEIYPLYKEDLELEISLTYVIQGSFHVFLRHAQHVDHQQLIERMGSICEQLLSSDVWKKAGK